MRRDRLDLNLLIALDALLAEQNVTRAAARLRVGQPAMSASLGRLRRVFGDQLLVRSGRSFAPTPLAQSLAGRLEGVLADIEHLLTMRPEFDPASATRTFTITASDYVTFTLLRHLIPVLYTEAPGITIRIQPLTGEFEKSIVRGDADLLVLPAEFSRAPRALPHRGLFKDDFVCVVWAGNSQVGDSISAEQFARMPRLASAERLGALAETRLRQLGVEQNIDVATQAFVLGPLLIRGTRLLTVVHRRVARELAPLTDTRILDPPFDLGTITQTMYWHPRTDDDPAHRWLRDRISVLADMPALIL